METFLYKHRLTLSIIVLALLTLTSCLEDPIRNEIEDNYLSSIIVLDGTYITNSSEGNIYISENAKNWQIIPTTNTNLLLSLDGKGEYSVCSGENGTILVSTDKGNSWEVKATGVSSFLKNVKIINDSTYIASGESGRVIISSDYGETWSQIETEFSSTVNDMAVLGDIVYFGLRSSNEPTELLYKYDLIRDTLELTNLEFNELVSDISVVDGEIYVSDFSACYKLINQNEVYSKEEIFTNVDENYIITDVLDLNNELVLVGNLGFNLGKLIVDAKGSKTEIEFDESIYFNSAIVNENKLIACGGDELELLIFDGNSSEIIKLK
ncbi:MAG: WD40/YVTN/BNR-like repeat-containing protein [Chlorobiota bacterium]